MKILERLLARERPIKGPSSELEENSGSPLDLSRGRLGTKLALALALLLPAAKSIAQAPEDNINVDQVKAGKISSDRETDPFLQASDIVASLTGNSGEMRGAELAPITVTDYCLPDPAGLINCLLLRGRYAISAKRVFLGGSKKDVVLNRISTRPGVTDGSSLTLPNQGSGVAASASGLVVMSDNCDNPAIPEAQRGVSFRYSSASPSARLEITVTDTDT